MLKEWLKHRDDLAEIIPNPYKPIHGTVLFALVAQLGAPQSYLGETVEAAPRLEQDVV